MQFAAQGTVDGGYVDSKSLRMARFAELTEKDAALRAARELKDAVQKAVAALDADVHRAEDTFLKADKQQQKLQRELVDQGERIADAQSQVCIPRDSSASVGVPNSKIHR